MSTVIKIIVIKISVKTSVKIPGHPILANNLECVISYNITQWAKFLFVPLP